LYRDRASTLPNLYHDGKKHAIPSLHRDSFLSPLARGTGTLPGWLRQVTLTAGVAGRPRKVNFTIFEKNYTMTVSELKLKLFRQIDSLEKNKLEELYGVLLNYINGQKDITEWDKLSDSQKQGIFDSIRELESGKGIPNKVILDKFRKKFNA
jgi:hypothetical protein